MNLYLLFASLLLPLAAIAVMWRYRPRKRRAAAATLCSRDMLQRDAQAMYLRLRTALPQYMIFARASLSAFVEVKGSNRTAVQARQAELAGKTTDFLICSGDFRVVAAVELEDLVRGRRHDERCSALLREASIPVLRWTTISLPTIRDIQEAIAEVETMHLISNGLRARTTDGSAQARDADRIDRRAPRF